MHGPLLQAAIDALDLGLHLPEGRTSVGGFVLGLAALFAARFELGGEVFDGTRERRGFGIGLAEQGFEHSQLLLGLAKVAFQR